MSTEDPIQNALALSLGARFYRCALQVNPQHYAETYRGQASDRDEESYAEALIEQAEALDIKVLAVTDHNHVGGVNLIREKAQKRGIHVFPGFELASTEGIHVLCLYPPNTNAEQLGRFLGEFGIRETSPSSALCDKSFAEILPRVREQGGITIAAHATNDNGILKELDGQAKIRNWRNTDLLALQLPGSPTDLPHNLSLIIGNKNPDYQRKHPPESDLAVAVVNAKDIAKPEDLADPAATCFIKMSEVSIDGLRQAFLDPGSRIRLGSDPEPEERAEFVAMSWEGGFLDGTGIHFNENLNVLIGGRGTGKSTVIESLRYVLGLEPLGEEARKAHEGIVRYVLQPGTKVSLRVRCHRPARREYRIERTVPNPPVVRDVETGEVVNLTPAQVLPRVEVFGQHEIAELTKSPEKLTRLLERFAERDDSLTKRKRDLRRDLDRSRSKVLEVRKEREQVDERLAALPGLEETLKSYQEAGLEERLKEQSLLVREERVLQTVQERLSPYDDYLVQLRGELPIDVAFLSPKALADLPGREILSGANEVFERLNRDLTKAADEIQAALGRAEQSLVGVREAWGKRKVEVQAAYEEKLRELQKSRVDGEEFIRLRRDIEALRPLKEREAQLRHHEAEYAERRQNLRAEWEDVKQEEFQVLNRAGKKVTHKLAGRVRVRVTFAGNREPLFQLLRSEIGGNLAKTVERLRDCQDLSLAELADTARKGADELRYCYALTPAQSKNIADAGDALWMQIEELELSSTTRIELNTAARGEPASFQDLEKLSTGQKATAVLLLLLLESDAPLLVDQPEDDLDNRFIFEEIVPRMREEKRRRQFVFSTHNANIPVLGDAELILGLSASGEASEGQARIAPEHVGSIDTRPVRELVSELLEGGIVAFELRRLKYGF
jgi:energy-coupling factor transporter ATP-binding protein EcfA2